MRLTIRQKTVVQKTDTDNNKNITHYIPVQLTLISIKYRNYMRYNQIIMKAIQKSDNKRTIQLNILNYTQKLTSIPV